MNVAELLLRTARCGGSLQTVKVVIIANFKILNRLHAHRLQCACLSPTRSTLPCLAESVKGLPVNWWLIESCDHPVQPKASTSTAPDATLCNTFQKCRAQNCKSAGLCFAQHVKSVKAYQSDIASSSPVDSAYRAQSQVVVDTTRSTFPDVHRVCYKASSTRSFTLYVSEGYTKFRDGVKWLSDDRALV